VTHSLHVFEVSGDAAPRPTAMRVLRLPGDVGQDAKEVAEMVLDKLLGPSGPFETLAVDEAGKASLHAPAQVWTAILGTEDEGVLLSLSQDHRAGSPTAEILVAGRMVLVKPSEDNVLRLSPSVGSAPPWPPAIEAPAPGRGDS
jgi:hypothetical protein